MFNWVKMGDAINKEIEIIESKKNIQKNNKVTGEIKEENIDNGFKYVYHVKLLYKNEPTLNVTKIVNELKKSCGDVDIICGNEKSNFFGVTFNDYCVEEKDISIPVEGVVGKTEIDKSKLDKLIKNSPNINEEEHILSGVKYQLLITDMMAAKLDYRKRLDIINNLLIAVIENTDCVAINWELSEQVIDPKIYLEKVKKDKLFGAINIRINEENGLKIIDTLGFAALGIPDLQCKFKDLNVKDVEGVIKNSCNLMYELGSVIEDGQIIQGIDITDKWKCNHTIGDIKPQRKVINIDILNNIDIK